MKKKLSLKISILGAGSWGTAVATVLANNGYNVKLWCFEQSVVDDITKNRVNKKYLPQIKLDEKITATSSIKDCIEKADIIFEAVPVLFLRRVLDTAKPFVKKEKSWVVLSKGIEKDTLLFPTQIIEDVFDFKPEIAVLSGPNFANQLGQKELTASLVASKSEKLLKNLKEILSNEYFKIYLSDDLIGAQVGGALKNVISLVLGAVEGFGYKENRSAFFLTIGFLEIIKFAEFFGGKTETICGLSGLGDLALGLIGKKNRNYKVGVLFGQGKSLKEVSEMLDVLPEGINTVESVNQIIKKEKLDLPVLSSAYKIVFGNNKDFGLKIFGLG